MTGTDEFGIVLVGFFIFTIVIIIIYKAATIIDRLEDKLYIVMNVLKREQNECSYCGVCEFCEALAKIKDLR